MHLDNSRCYLRPDSRSSIVANHHTRRLCTTAIRNPELIAPCSCTYSLDRRGFSNANARRTGKRRPRVGRGSCTHAPHKGSAGRLLTCVHLISSPMDGGRVQDALRRHKLASLFMYVGTYLSGLSSHVRFIVFDCVTTRLVHTCTTVCCTLQFDRRKNYRR